VLTLTKLIGQDALPYLVALSEDLNLHVRRAAAQSMAELDYLTSEAKSALLRLAMDEDTAEFTREALEVHDLSAIRPMLPVEQKMKAPVPEELQTKSGSLLTLLESWQEALPDLQRDFDLEELSEVDQALSTLIVHLRRLTDMSE
jgi:hypothetical protein